jgi:predicted negative regulator of RcsB-dependent stress response
MSHSSTFFLLSVLMLLTVLLVFAMKYWSAARRADMQIAHANNYRELAEKLATLQGASTGKLGMLEHDVGDMNARLARIEKILREVE